MLFKRFTIIFISILFQSLKSSSQVLNFTYNGFHTFSDISTQGITAVTPNGLLRLTNTTILQTAPFHPSPQPSSLLFSLISRHLAAMASPLSLPPPNTSLPYATASQYMGLFNITSNGNDTNHVFVVELDTIQSTEFNDTNNNHVEIDINSLTSVQSSPAGWWDKKGQFKNLTLTSCLGRLRWSYA
ncbi:unnamed protein product, partial [Thlaspi arvense]